MTGQKAIQTARRSHPDIVLLDVSLPDISGLEVLRRIRSELPRTKVVIYSVHKGIEYVKAAIESGASGYIAKDSPSSRIIQAIELVSSSEEFYLFLGSARSSRHRPTPIVSKLERLTKAILFSPKADLILTAREKEIIGLMFQGFKISEIASRMNLSYYTITSHSKNIFRKLNVHSRSAAVAKVLRDLGT
jgi:DNA-binding NarL/FixJ family response regulator